MNDFENFASTLSKFRIKTPDEIVQDTEVSFRSSPVGNILFQILYISNKIKPIMLSLNERIPLISAGPQILLKVEFLKINSVQQRLKELTIELDKKVNNNTLKLNPLVESCFENLNKFNSKIPQLTSVNAPTYVSNIPEYQKYVTDATSSIDNILSTIPKIEQSQSVPAIDDKKLKQVQFNIAFINVIEELIIDFYILDSIEIIKKDKKFQPDTLKKWIKNLETIESKCFPKVSDDLSTLKDVLNILTTNSPSLFNVLSQIQPILSEPIYLHDFVSASELSILSMQYVYSIKTRTTNQGILDWIPKISASLVSGDTKTIDELVKYCISIHKETSDQITSSSFVGCGNDSGPTLGTLESLLQICSKGNFDSDLKMITAITVIRFYAMTVSDYEFSEHALVLLTREISLVLKHNFQAAFDTSDRIYQLYNANLSIFNEKILGYLSYFIMQVKAIKSLEIDSGFFIPTVHKAFNLIGALPTALEKVIQECKKETVKKALQDEYDKLVALANKYTKWVTQFFLCLSSFVQLSCEASSKTFAYLKEIRLQIPDAVTQAAAEMQSALQSSPQYILMDITDIAKLRDNFLTVHNNAQDLTNALASQDKSPFYSLIILFLKALRIFSSELKSQSSQVTSILKFDEAFDIVSALTAYLSQLVPLFKDAESYIQKSPKSFAFFFSIPYSCLNNVCAIITENSALTSQLLHYPPTVKVSLEVLWPIASSVASGSGKADENEVKSLSLYSNSLMKLLSDMLKTVNSMPQPFEEINIPEDVRELKSMDKTSSALKPSLKVYGDWIISWIRDKKVPTEQGIMIARKWFRACQTPSSDYHQAVQLFLQTILEFLSKQDSVEQIYDRFCFLSASLGDNEPKFGRYVSFIQYAHTRLFNAIKDILCGEKHLTRAGLKMLSSIIQIQSFSTFGVLNVKNQTKQSNLAFYTNFYSKLFRKQYKDTLMILPKVKKDGKSMGVMISSVTSMNQLVALDSISQLDKYKEKINVVEILDPIQKAVMNKKSCAEQIDTAISTFSERLIELTPNAFNSLNTYNNFDKVDDGINEKVEAFRELSNNILVELNVKELDNQHFVDLIKSQNVSSLEAIALTMQGLKVLKLFDNKSYSDQFIEGFGLILKFVSLFDSLSISAHSSSKSANNELRYQNRVIARQLDAFITMIESSSQNENVEDESELAKSVRKMIEDLCSVLLFVSHISSCALIAVVPEMYDKFEKDLETKLQSAFKAFSTSASEVKSIAVGPSMLELTDTISEFETHFKQFVDNSKSVDFYDESSSSFPQINLVKEMHSLGELSTKIYKISPELTDVSIIEPDPQAAEMIPSDFEVPPVSSPSDSNSSPSAILSSLYKAQQNVEKVLSESKEKVFDNSASDSESIVKFVRQVDEACLAFCQLGRQMISACQDQRLGELQTAIFTFASVVTNLHDAAKKRLLRDVNFEVETEEAFSQFSPQIKVVVDLAAAASKKEEELAQQAAAQEEVPEGPSDEVTRELMATENAINEMSARLANFSAMLDMPDETLDEGGDEAAAAAGIENLKAEEGTLPAYVISKASIILETTSHIIQRAQIMTRELLKNGGNLSNEKRLIELAQDISESAQLLLIVAEILIKKSEKDAEFKVIAASRFIRHSIANFVTKILQIGGDNEGKINQYTKVINNNADLVIQKSTKIANEKIAENDKFKSVVPKTSVAAMTLRNNIDSTIREYQKQNEQYSNEMKKLNKKY